MPPVEAPQGPIQLNWEDDGDVVVLAKDKHRFLLTMQQAADACARGSEQLVWKEEFDRILKRLHGWIKDHAASVSAAYVGFLEGQVAFFIVPEGERMNFALSDEIALLEVELYQDFANCKGEVRQIPGHTADALETFLDLDQALQIYGQPLPTPPPVGA